MTSAAIRFGIPGCVTDAAFGDGIRTFRAVGNVAFDAAICKDGEPVVIEMNLGGPGAVLYRYANGPFFGDKTQQVIDWCKDRPLRQMPRDLP